MMKRTVCALILFLSLATSAQEVLAQDEHPIQLSLLAPVQLVPEDEGVRGVRLSLFYGKNTSVTGVDIGAVNHTTRDFLGVQFGFVGVAEGSFTGAQLNWVNVVDGSFEGFQWGIVSSVDDGLGLQLSGVNHARNFRGLQVALVNYAETLDGIQLGLVNIIREGGVLPVMPFVNWSLDEGAGN
jgi:hypothetical protein